MKPLTKIKKREALAFIIIFIIFLFTIYIFISKYNAKFSVFQGEIWAVKLFYLESWGNCLAIDYNRKQIFVSGICMPTNEIGSEDNNLAEMLNFIFGFNSDGNLIHENYLNQEIPGAFITDIELNGDGNIFYFNYDYIKRFSIKENNVQILYDTKALAYFEVNGDNIYACDEGRNIKLEETGKLIWQREEPYVFSYSYYGDCAIDNNGNVLFAFNYISKYDTEGNLLFNYLLPGNCKRIIIDENNNIYVCGRIINKNKSSGKYGSFICKFNENGQMIWNKEWEVKINSMAVNVINKSIVIIGDFETCIDFEPETNGKFKICSKKCYKNHSGYTNSAFICEIDYYGKLRKVIGSKKFSFGEDIQIMDGEMYITGSCEDHAYLVKLKF